MSALKDSWDKAGIVGALLLPPVLVVMGYFLGEGLERGQIKAKYVEIAVNILNEGVSPQPLRQWALSILKASSPSSIPPSLEEFALNLSIERPKYRTSGAFGDGMPFLELVAPESNRFGDFFYVRLDGKLVAETPSTLSVLPGDHEITWLNQEGSSVCQISYTFTEWKYSLECVQKTGEVNLNLPPKRTK